MEILREKMDEESKEKNKLQEMFKFPLELWAGSLESVVHSKSASVSSYMTVSVYACEGRL